jgi:hypothetical protein
MVDHAILRKKPVLYRDAASVAGLLITTEAIVVEAPKKEAYPPGPAPIEVEIADFADIPSPSFLALPKSVDNGNLGLNEFVIQWMSV